MNINNKTLKKCSTNPMTGFYRDGYCQTGPDDKGTHTVCAKMTQEFLDYTKSKGNDLSTPNMMYNFPGLKPGDKWCLCEYRWNQAFESGSKYTPFVDESATNIKTKKNIANNIKTHNNRKKVESKKSFYFNPNNPKKSFNVYTNKNPSNTIPTKYDTLESLKSTIKKLENLYKSNRYSHDRISKISNLLYLRLRAIKNRELAKKRLILAKRYKEFLKKRTAQKKNNNRKKMTFKNYNVNNRNILNNL